MSLMDADITNHTVVEFIEIVSEQQHAMAGAIIALSAGQAIALGQACMQISIDEESKNNSQAEEEKVVRLAQIKAELIQWCNRDATAIAEFVALREAGDPLAGQELLCTAPVEVCKISIEGTNILQDFRPLISERVRDDLEMAISLLAGAAQAAMLLLDSNLRIWPDSALLNQFEPIQLELLTEISLLNPVTRIR